MHTLLLTEPLASGLEFRDIGRRPEDKTHPASLKCTHVTTLILFFSTSTHQMLAADGKAATYCGGRESCGLDTLNPKPQTLNPGP